MDPAEARADSRPLSSGSGVGFVFPGAAGAPVYRVAPAVWYCWLAVRALGESSWAGRLADFGGFTEAGARPWARPPEGCPSLAWCCAFYEALSERELLDAAASMPGFVRLWEMWRPWLRGTGPSMTDYG